METQIIMDYNGDTRHSFVRKVKALWRPSTASRHLRVLASCGNSYYFLEIGGQRRTNFDPNVKRRLFFPRLVGALTPVRFCDAFFTVAERSPPAALAKRA